MIDQDPLIIQLVSLDTRFVLVSDPKATASSKRDDLKAKNRKGRKVEDWETPALNIQTSDPIPILERRKPTPYSFTRTPTGRMTNADYLLSPESTIPHTTASMPRSMPAEDGFKSMKNHSRKNSSMTSESTANRSDSSDDSEVDKRATLQNRSIHGSRSARTSSTDLPGMHARHQSIINPPKRSDFSKNILDPSSSRNQQSDYLNKTSRSHREPSGNTTSSSKPLSGKQGSDDQHYFETRHISIASPLVAPGARTPLGGSSPRPDSRPESPQSPWEPFSFESQKASQDRLPEYNLPLHQKSKPPSRLSSVNQAYRNESSDIPRIDIKGPSPASNSGLPYPDADQNRGGSALPYPDEDHPMAMPDQNHYIFTPAPTNSQTPRSVSASPNYSDTPKSNQPKETRKASDYDSKPLPPLNRTTSLHSKTNYESQSGPPLNRTTSLRSEPESSKTSSSSSPTVVPNLPSCPRRKFTKQYNDWYALKGCKNFDVCPSCHREIIKNSSFRHYFSPSQPHPPNVAVRCDFGSLWIRLAWLLMIKEQRKDVDLIHALAKVSDEERPCPENDQRVGIWYGVLDRRGNFVENFFVCPRDKASIETLFPSLKGAFYRLPSSRIPALCVLRSESRRFPTYIDALDSIHDSALKQYRKSYVSSRNPPLLTDHADLTPLIKLTSNLASLPECPRDRATPNLAWHYISDMPDLTVCPECYDEVIAPDAERNLTLGLAFTSTPGPVPSSAVATNLAPGAIHGMPDGFTCCLYSERMRDAWDDAVMSNNADGGVMRWVAIARERRKRECELGVRKADLLRMAGSVRADLFGAPGDAQWVKGELQKVEDEWEKWE